MSDVKNDEQWCLDNMLENLQNGERYETMEAAVDYLDDAEGSIGDTKVNISSEIG